MNGRKIDYARQYAKWHDDTDAHFEEMANSELSWLRKYLPENPQAGVLDIGCGMGFLLGAMKLAGYANAEGLDADSGQVAKARRKGLAVHLVSPADFREWMGQRTRRYSLITAIDVLEHVAAEDQVEFVEAIAEAVAPDGVFLCRVPNGNSSVSGRLRYIDWTHVTSFTEHSLDFVLFNAGFSRVEISETPRGSGAIPNAREILLTMFRTWRRIEMIAEFGLKEGRSIPLTPNILALARR